MYIGNIVTDTLLDDENINFCRDIKDIDDTLPTLIIGWTKTKELFGEEVSILHKQINSKLFWTFTPKERKSEYDSDYDSFMTLCYNSFGENIPYVYLDILHGKRKINFRVIRKLLSLKNPIVYISENEMVYIYGENIIFGVDLNVLSLLGGKKEKVIEKVKTLENCILVDSEIFNKCKDFLYKIKNKNRYVPYIYSYGIKQ
jgi:hypothetical protein